MTVGGREGSQGAASAPFRPASAAVLADRMAAALVHHEPGWRLPRLTALARRYSVSTAEIDTAIDELAARHLVRRLPDGQVYRASPAEYWVPLEGVFGLASHVDPMGGQIACRTRHSSRRRPPEDVGRALGLAPGELAVVVRCLWTVGGEPGALSASYLPERCALALAEGPGDDPAVWEPETGTGDGGYPAARVPFPRQGATPARRAVLFPWGPEGDAAARPQAVQLEMGLPPPSAARSLRITAGEPVATVTVSFASPAGGLPVALTMAMLRPELFRIVLGAPAGVAAGSSVGLPTAWTRLERDWEP